VPTGRLVVLGEPGSGKTVLVLRLVLDLLGRRRSGDPVPVLVSAASWDPTVSGPYGWLAGQLALSYPSLAGTADPGSVSRRFRMLIDSGLIVPVLDGLDEITLTGPTRIAEIHDGAVRTYEITPEEFGITRAGLDDISGGDSTANAVLIRKVLGGDKSPRRDVVLLNAAAALVVAGRAEHIGDALPVAARSIDSGAAARKLKALVRFTANG